MSNDRDQYRKEFNENRRLITYAEPHVKAALKQAVDDKLCKSVSKLSADIIEQNFEKHIEDLKNGSES